MCIRIDRYKKFKDFGSRIMVATNLFGRGVDFERVNVVINYDMSEDPDTYLHRVGRAGRFGTKGLALSFVSSKEDAEVLNQVQKRFVVDIPALPEHIDTSTYSKYFNSFFFGLKSTNSCFSSERLNSTFD